MDSINRPTSRVLAPPGGGCSNIFGGGPEPTKAFNKNDPRHKTNNIFGCPEPVQKPTPPAAEPVKADTQPAKIEAPAPTSAIAPTAPVQNQKTQENNPVGVSNLVHLTFNYYKVECVFPMVISSDFRTRQHRDDDHLEHASHFTYSLRHLV